MRETQKKERHKIIPIVYLVLQDGDQTLFSRRKNTGFHDEEYSLPAGHVEKNETLTDAVIREAKEEIGIKLNLDNLRLVHVVHRKEAKEKLVDFFFQAKKWSGTIKNLEPQKCSDLRWAKTQEPIPTTSQYVKKPIQKSANLKKTMDNQSSL